jgi:transcriptional regulator with XRE-family HTH domain
MATPDETQRNLGLAVKALRTNLGITQEELSSRTGVHPTYISDIERGARNPSWAALVKLVRGMNSTMTDLGSAFDQIEAG